MLCRGRTPIGALTSLWKWRLRIGRWWRGGGDGEWRMTFPRVLAVWMGWRCAAYQRFGVLGEFGVLGICLLLLLFLIRSKEFFFSFFFC